MTSAERARLARIGKLVSIAQSDNTAQNILSFAMDQRLVHATAYRLLHIGENAARLDLTTKARHNHIPWRNIAAMRNVLAHDYDGVDLAIVWATVTEHLEPLAAMCQAELND